MCCRMFGTVAAALLFATGLIADDAKKNDGKTAVQKAGEDCGCLNISAQADRNDAIYKAGEKIKFTLRLTDSAKKQVAGKKIGYSLTSWDGRLQKSEVATTTAEPMIVETSLDKPGWIMLEAALLDADSKPVYNAKKQKVALKTGAMVDPLKIRPGVEEPADFKKFWDDQRATLAKVPVKAKSEKVDLPANLKNRYVCYDVKVDCVDKVPVSGYLTMPLNAKPKSLPAVVSYHGAGVYSAGKPFRGNAISFDVNAHGILNGQSKEYYRNLSANELKGYWYRDRDDRDRFYFRNMYLRVLRALDYVKTLPEWDGKNLIVVGSSQGGAQSIVAAALDPQVTLCLTAVPAMSDHGGNLAGRLSGWPRLFSVKDGKPMNLKVAEASRYYDNVNFAKYIKAPVYMTAGMIDMTCVPTSVYAVYNNLPASTEKHMTAFPSLGHVGQNPEGNKAISKILNPAPAKK